MWLAKVFGRKYSEEDVFGVGAGQAVRSPSDIRGAPVGSAVFPLPGRRGFTLIELLLVILIISILAALVVPRFAKRSEEARVSAAIVDVRANLATALDLYELDNGNYPTSSQGLEALIREPTGSPRPRNWNGPYVRGGLPKDPWGQAYVYRSPCSRPNCDYELLSCGPDGAEGGDDDITSWEAEN